MPIRPFDVRGWPPINRKEDVYTVNHKDGLSLERVKFDPIHDSKPENFFNELQRQDTRRPHHKRYALDFTPWLSIIGRVKPGVDIAPLQAKVSELVWQSFATATTF